MESEFVPAVRTEETPEARIVIVDLPGFRGKDVTVEVDEQGNLFISGERSVNEMGEITKEGGKLDRMQSGGHTFRKVISIPENVNVEDITANLKNQVLRVSLPFVQKNQKLRTEDVNGGPKPHVTDLSEQSKPHVADLSEQSKQDERPNPLNSGRRLGYEMESEFEPAVRSEETPEARVVIVDLPGFRRKDVRVQIDDHGNLIISGERSVNEMGEVRKEGGRLDTTQSRVYTFRKVISIPHNVNAEDITAKFKNQVLHVSLPFVQKNHQLLTEDVNGGGKQSKKEERSSPLRQQGLMQERRAATEKVDEGAKLPEVIRPDDLKAKGNETAEESEAEAPKHAEDIVHGEQPICVSTVEAGSDGEQSKSKQRRIHILSPSMLICNGGLFVASTLLVLCAAMYIYYILRSRKSD